MNYDYKNMSINNFLDELKSGKSVPGGGATAALDSAQGVALLMMVANHTIGKKKYEEVELLNRDAIDKCEKLLQKLIAGIDKDAKAFGMVASAYAIKNDNPKVRLSAIAKASVDATKAPLEVMSDSVKALEIANKLLGHSNKNLESDICVAALSLQAGMLSARYNVFANLPSIRSQDEVLADKLKKLANLLTKKGLALAGIVIAGTGEEES